jgi:hypothetical protein
MKGILEKLSIHTDALIKTVELKQNGHIDSFSEYAKKYNDTLTRYIRYFC